MAEEIKNVPEQEVPKVVTEESSAATGEVTDRGLFDFLGKKKEEDKPQETLESEFEHKAQISEPVPVVKLEEEEEEEKKPSLLEKLHRNDSSSSSSSEEEGEDGEKRKKKKKDKKKTTTATEGEVKTEEEKKGFMEKLKEKLPGHGKKPEDATTTATPVAVPPPVEEAHPVEKKGILEKIKEKLPGYHPKTVEEEKKGKESG